MNVYLILHDSLILLMYFNKNNNHKTIYTSLMILFFLKSMRPKITRPF